MFLQALVVTSKVGTMILSYCYRNLYFYTLIVVQLLNCVQLFTTSSTAAHQAPLSPGICSNSFPLSQWCYLTISSSVAPFSFCLQSFPASESSPIGKDSSHQVATNIGASASPSVLPMIIQGWFPLGLTDLLAVQGNFKSLLWHHNSKASIPCSAIFMVQLSYTNMATGKQ